MIVFMVLAESRWLEGVQNYPADYNASSVKPEKWLKSGKLVPGIHTILGNKGPPSHSNFERVTT